MYRLLLHIYIYIYIYIYTYNMLIGYILALEYNCNAHFHLWLRYLTDLVACSHSTPLRHLHYDYSSQIQYQDGGNLPSVSLFHCRPRLIVDWTTAFTKNSKSECKHCSFITKLLTDYIGINNYSMHKLQQYIHTMHNWQYISVRCIRSTTVAQTIFTCQVGTDRMI